MKNQLISNYHILSQIDIFAYPIQFSFNKQNKQGTIFGGILTITLYSLFLAIFILVSADLWQRQSPVVHQSTIAEQTQILLKDYPIQIIVYNNQNLPTENFENLLQFQVLIENFQPESILSYSRSLIVCSKKLSQFSPNAQDQINDKYLSTSFCIDFEENDYINGDVPQGNSNFLNIFAHLCTEGSNCLSLNEIQQQIQGWYMVVSFCGVTIENNNNYLNPAQRSPLSVLINFCQTLIKQVTINIGQSILQSDDGLLFQNYTYYKGMKKVSVIQDYGDIKSFSVNGQITMVNVLIGWSSQQIIINRTYMKIPDALAKSFSCLSLLFWCFKIAMKTYEYFSFQLFVYDQIVQNNVNILKKEEKTLDIPKNYLESQQKYQNNLLLYYYAYINEIPCVKKRLKIRNSDLYNYFEKINNTTKEILSLETIIQNIFITQQNQIQLNTKFKEYTYHQDLNQENISEIQLKLSPVPFRSQIRKFQRNNNEFELEKIV